MAKKARKKKSKRYAGPKALKGRVTASRFHRLERRVSKLGHRVDKVEATTEKTLKLVTEMASTWASVRRRSKARRAAA